MICKKVNEKDSKHIQTLHSIQPKKPKLSETINRTDHKPSNEQLFDKLLSVQLSQKSLRINKIGSKRVYSNRKKDKENSDQDFELLNFENVANREFVVQWLGDTRNEFDRLTQTQNIDNEIELEANLVPILPSISQRKTLDDFIKPMKIHRKARSRSVDIEPKIIKHPDRWSDTMDNYNIEDINTEEDDLKEKAEENVLLNLIEDDFLDRLETELDHPSETQTLRKSTKSFSVEVNHSADSETPRKSTKNVGEEVNHSADLERSRKNSEGASRVSLNASVTTNSGWERVTEMQKNLKTNSREPKQLKILVESISPGSMKKDKDSSKVKLNRSADTGILEIEENIRKVIFLNNLWFNVKILLDNFQF